MEITTKPYKRFPYPSAASARGVFHCGTIGWKSGRGYKMCQHPMRDHSTSCGKHNKNTVWGTWKKLCFDYRSKKADAAAFLKLYSKYKSVLERAMKDSLRRFDMGCGRRPVSLPQSPSARTRSRHKKKKPAKQSAKSGRRVDDDEDSESDFELVSEEEEEDAIVAEAAKERSALFKNGARRGRPVLFARRPTSRKRARRPIAQPASSDRETQRSGSESSDDTEDEGEANSRIPPPPPPRKRLRTSEDQQQQQAPALAPAPVPAAPPKWRTITVQTNDTGIMLRPSLRRVVGWCSAVTQAEWKLNMRQEGKRGDRQFHIDFTIDGILTDPGPVHRAAISGSAGGARERQAVRAEVDPSALNPPVDAEPLPRVHLAPIDQQQQPQPRRSRIADLVFDPLSSAATSTSSAFEMVSPTHVLGAYPPLPPDGPPRAPTPGRSGTTTTTQTAAGQRRGSVEY